MSTPRRQPQSFPLSPFSRQKRRLRSHQSGDLYPGWGKRRIREKREIERAVNSLSLFTAAVDMASNQMTKWSRSFSPPPPLSPSSLSPPFLLYVPPSTAVDTTSNQMTKLVFRSFPYRGGTCTLPRTCPRSPSARGNRGRRCCS